MTSQTDNSQTTGKLLTTYKAEIILLFVTVTWGLSFPLIKISIDYISPVFFIFLRFLLTLAVFMIIFGRKFRVKNTAMWKSGALLGVFLFFGFALQNIGMKYTSATKSAFITGTSLVMIPFVQFYIIRLKPKPENIFGGLIVLAGLYILSEAHLSMPNAGDILTLIAAFVFAIHVVLLNKFSESHGEKQADPENNNSSDNFYYLVFGQFLMMVVLSLVFMIIFEHFIFNELYIHYSGELVSCLIYTAIISTLLSIFLMTKYQKKTTPLRAGIIYSMESVFAVIFAFIILGETLNSNQITGALIMLAGLIISEFYGFFRSKFFR